VIAFFFFAFSLSEKPYHSKNMNIIKIVSEFQIFGVLLVCVVLQTNAHGLDGEYITIDGYGLVQIVLTMFIVPVVLYLLRDSSKNFKHMIADALDDGDEDENVTFENPANDGSHEETNRTSEGLAFENPENEASPQETHRTVAEAI
jgi:hypothetical protein